MVNKVVKFLLVIICYICIVGCNKSNVEDIESMPLIEKQYEFDEREEERTDDNLQISESCSMKESALFSTEKFIKDDESYVLPDIVFMYSSHYNYEKFKKYLIDKNGNIFFSDNEDIWNRNYKDDLKSYADNTLQKEMMLVGKVEALELEKNYALLMDVINEEKHELVSSEIGIDAIVEEKTWNALYFDDCESINIVKLFRKGSVEYENLDTRVYDTVEWMNEVIENALADDEKEKVELR